MTRALIEDGHGRRAVSVNDHAVVRPITVPVSILPIRTISNTRTVVASVDMNGGDGCWCGTCGRTVEKVDEVAPPSDVFMESRC